MKIGVMQGRLLPKYKNKYQAHPLGLWREEFFIAKELGLNSIEFILDYEDFEKNPLMSHEGINDILNIISKTNVEVKSICADYFMEAPLHSEDELIAKTSVEILNRLLLNGSKINVSHIVIPCVDNSSLKDQNQVKKLVNNLKEPILLAKKLNINLALETDLSPNEFKKLLDLFNEEIITVNYDIGNSASLGYNIKEEFSKYGNKISDIHIKDRLYGGGSVFLGEGDADFDSFFMLLSKINFKGPIIMQAYRDNEGLEIFKKQLNWFKQKLNDSSYPS